MSQVRTPEKWGEILRACGVKPPQVKVWAPVFAELIGPGTFTLGDGEVDDFLAQILHESAMLTKLEEGLNYSVEGLLSTFKRHRISEADARRYGRIDGKQAANKQAIANTVYGGEWGLVNLGNKLPNDGWDCRGSGVIQVTGLANLTALARILNHPNPRALGVALRTDPRTALHASILWWEGKIPDSIVGNVQKVTKAVNGGAIGLDDRKRLAALVARALA